MVEKSKRTRSTKKVKKRTPGARTVTHYGSKKAGKAQCGLCGKAMAQVKTGSATEMKNTPKSSKAPARPYRGTLCSPCLDDLVRYVTRMEAKFSSQDMDAVEIERDLKLEKYLPRGWYGKASEGHIMKPHKKANPVRKTKTQ
jgi:large subunit ribosomal protein L34e